MPKQALPQKVEAWETPVSWPELTFHEPQSAIRSFPMRTRSVVRRPSPLAGIALWLSFLLGILLLALVLITA